MFKWFHGLPEVEDGYNWSARAEEVRAKYAEQAEVNLAEYRKDPVFKIHVGKTSLVVTQKNRAAQIPFPVQTLLSLTPGSGPSIKNVVVHFNELSDHTYMGFGTKELADQLFPHSTEAPYACRGRPDTVRCGGSSYEFPFGKGRLVYDLLLANMVESS